MTSSLHADQIVFDGLIVANWGPDIFLDMRRGGLTAGAAPGKDLPIPCAISRAGTRGFMNIPTSSWKARTAADIRKAKENNQTGLFSASRMSPHSKIRRRFGSAA